MIEQMLDHGYKIVDFEELADIYIINTCTVTNMADKKSRQMIRRVKQINPETVLVAVGCYAQVAKEKLEQIPEIDLILGIKEKKEIVKYVEQFIEKQKKVVAVSELKPQDKYTEFGAVTHTERTRAVIKIEDGCNQFCTYCIIPYARGRVRSRAPENILDEVEKIAQNGIKEVVLTGINLSVYGQELHNYGLIELLEDINKIDGIERIRLGSLDPVIITEDFVKRLSKLEKVCDHFHLSLQSGCDATLKRMNRKYLSVQITQAATLIRKYFANAALTADIIVGFPGETVEEFEQTYELLKEIKLYKIHVFKYSPRSGTVAEKMPNQVDGNVKEQRSNRLIELSNKSEMEFNKACIGKTLSVLMEEQDGEWIKGHTTNYRLVKVKADGSVHENEVVDVRISSCDALELVGVCKLSPN